MGCGCNKKRKKTGRKVSRTTSSVKRNIKKLPIVSTSNLKKTKKIKK